MPEPPFVTIDHVQLAIPKGGEAAARRFYGELLGFAEVAKPPALDVRGGCWFESGEFHDVGTPKGLAEALPVLMKGL